jgi:hypothetical protein
MERSPIKTMGMVASLDGPPDGRKAAQKTIRTCVDTLNDIMGQLPSAGFISKQASGSFITANSKCSQQCAKDTHWCLVARNILRKMNSGYELCKPNGESGRA